MMVNIHNVTTEDSAIDTDTYDEAAQYGWAYVPQQSHRNDNPIHTAWTPDTSQRYNLCNELVAEYFIDQEESGNIESIGAYDIQDYVSRTIADRIDTRQHTILQWIGRHVRLVETVDVAERDDWIHKSRVEELLDEHGLEKWKEGYKEGVAES